MCSLTGCVIRPLNDINALSIDASDLQRDQAHKGLLILTATIRNRAGYPIGYPQLELSLTGTQEASGKDVIVARRVLAPADYVGGTADIAAGIPGNGELALRVFIDASAIESGRLSSVPLLHLKVPFAPNRCVFAGPMWIPCSSLPQAEVR